MKVLITGVYGFIGFSTAVRLLAEGYEVYGIDKIRDAISPKEERRAFLSVYKGFHFKELNLSDFDQIDSFMVSEKFDIVLHFAGQYSVANNDKTLPQYFEGNVAGFFNVIRAAHRAKVQRFIYASSTFVSDGVTPDNMYACTKVFNEHLANVYSSRFNMLTVGLRFGSTYGPFIRPDVGLFQIARKLYSGVAIDVSHPAFTYKVGFLFIDDAVECVVRSMGVSFADRHNVMTLVARDNTANLMNMLMALKKHTGRSPNMVNFEEWKAGDIPEGYVPTLPCAKVYDLLGYCPETTLDEGIEKTVSWFDEYFSSGDRVC